jgi:N-sulfoglucosamine sulfohydrolase
MKRTRFPYRLAFLASLLGLPWSARAADGPRPDIVIFLSDDQGRLDASPYGARELRTPRMQQLADAGLTFDRAFVASPSCAPSRAALLTGLMPARNGAEANHSKPRAELRKWPAFFQDLGYEVAAFGKVSHYKHTGDYGFDHFAHDGFHDHASIPAAVEFLEGRDRATAKPLCLLVGSNWPHVPWPADVRGYDPATLPLPAGGVDTPATRRARARYAAAVTKADDDLGTILDAARATLGERTLFLFSSDHGAQWPFGKWNCYDAGIRVPLVVAWPGVVKPGTRTDAMVSWVDLLPTLLEAAGGEAPDDIDGRSFLPVLRGEAAGHRDRIFTTHSGDGRWNVYPIRSVRTPTWKLILNLHPEFAFTTHIDLPDDRGRRSYFSSWEAAAEGDPRAAEVVKRYHARPAEEFYDLAADPHERRNLASDPRHAARLATMRAELESWMESQGDRRTVFAEPRLLRDPASFGPIAPPGNVPAKSTAKEKARR